MDIHELNKAIANSKDKIAIVLPDGRVVMINDTIFCMQDDAIIITTKEIPLCTTGESNSELRK